MTTDSAAQLQADISIAQSQLRAARRYGNPARIARCAKRVDELLDRLSAARSRTAQGTP